MSSAAAAARHAPQRHVYEAYDPTVYPVGEKVGQDSLQEAALKRVAELEALLAGAAKREPSGCA